MAWSFLFHERENAAPMLISLSKWPKRRRPNTTGTRTAREPFVSETQWRIINDRFEDPDPSPEGGCPRVNARACFEGILWILKNGARWQDLPESYPSPPAYCRRHKAWTEACVMLKASERLLRIMDL